MKFTPYNFITSVLYRLGVPGNPKLIKGYLRIAKILLTKLREMGYDDNDILQMVDYTCHGMLKENRPRDFRYFSGIFQRFITAYTNSSVSEAPSIEFNTWIQQEIERLQAKNKS